MRLYYRCRTHRGTVIRYPVQEVFGYTSLGVAVLLEVPRMYQIKMTIPYDALEVGP